MAMQWLQERGDFSHILEMGCGNGILSVTAATIWDAEVLAADISDKALADAAAHIAANGMENRITLLKSDMFFAPQIKRRAPYDLIICNMLAHQLTQMAPDIRANLAQNGICILSGMLAWLAGDTKTAYKSLGFEIIKEIPNANWLTCVICDRLMTEKWLL